IVHMNLLCNPTGKENAFQAVDWLVEWNNLYTKVIFPGSRPNHTIENITKKSPLIEIYHNCHVTVENVFHLQYHTIRHMPPDMTKTIQQLSACIKEKSAHTHKAGCSAFCSIPDQVAKGIALMQIQKGIPDEAEPEGGEVEVEANDLSARAGGSCSRARVWWDVFGACMLSFRWFTDKLQAKFVRG
ncbi:hypothetical protein BS17DRAFT_701773, partial [Gyrodon lividus]